MTVRSTLMLMATLDAAFTSAGGASSSEAGPRFGEGVRVDKE
jgi:hypothetical protein